MLLRLIALLVLGICLRIYIILPIHSKKRQRSNGPIKLAVFLGSGGHTSEALGLMNALDFYRYSHRTYIVSEGDNLSARKAARLEELKSAVTTSFRILTVPRARRVHQPLFTTPTSALWSLFKSIHYVTLQPFLSGTYFSDVLLINGPGTCVTICLAIYVNKFFGLRAPTIIYIESFARVTRLSLSGRLLRPLVDRFVVQWPQLSQNDSGSECLGWLV